MRNNIFSFPFIRRFKFFVFLLLGWQGQLLAQATAFTTDPTVQFKQAQAFYLQEQYSLALPLLLELEQQVQSPSFANQPIQVEELRFYLLACRLQQNDERALAPSIEFINYTHNQPRTEQLSFHLGNYYFRKKEFYNALQYYERAGIASLSNEQIALTKFRMGYSFFHLKRFREAKPLLNTIRQLPNDPHYLDANYYYGFIAYADREYSDALTCFERVQQHPHYGSIVPFYLASIYYFRGDKDKAISIAETALKKKDVLYQLEMKQLLGHAWFEKQDYVKARLYLEEYVQRSEKVSREDLYELSYSYYQNKEYNKAIEGFRQLSGGADSLSQSAMYLLGDAYLKTGQKENARNAFAFCAANSSNQQQREVSLFNYAKLSYELGYQGVAITEVKRFLNDYPRSSYNREARELLVGLLAGTNNFRDALQLIESLEERSDATRRLYPRILYGRAAEYINDQQLSQAEELLDKILKDPNNAPVLPLTHFWKGEIALRNNRLDEAIRYLQLFLQSGSPGLGEASPREANYNLGYCYLRKENFPLALSYFQKVVSRVTLAAPPLEQDAWIRQADCYFMQRNYRQSLGMYQQVLDFSWPNADYALYQKAMIGGITSSKTKIDQLGTLQRLYPNSTLLPDAQMEIARTYMSDEKFREAIPYLNNVINHPQPTAFRQEALFQLGVAWYNLNKPDDALAQFKKLLQQYPHSPEAQDALENIRSIYVEQGRPEGYEDFVKSTGKTVSVSEADSLAYAAVEVKISNNDCNGIIQQVNQYLGRFPTGRYTLEAQYFRSECYTQRKDWKNALPGYEFVARQGNSRYAERSALLAARTYYFELQDFANAQPFYEILRNVAVTDENRMEALRGSLRCLYRLKEYKKAADVARELLAAKNAGTDDKALANLVTGRNHQLNNQYDLAIQSYRAVVNLNKGEWAAEARYEIARCQFDLNSLVNAEKAAFEVINKSGSYDLWVTSAYILLGDIYFKQKDFFNAKATYNSVAENATNPDLRAEAARKLRQVTEEEKRNSKIED
ncbi:MAG TPA: tetratricopeptide repeat protein [Lacibacter sp.]|nr:tetratricopeptide repeat protein [Lacibacter sp.]HMO89602.1 tetratricopeptide repeat protein [Lacibacter sp.]HMP86066.1 tetratricopeptide repeat protein [Lacibacter sp.]